MKTHTIILLMLIICSCEPKEDITLTPTPPKEIPARQDASYTVTFSFDWNSNDFPTDYPSGPHFSPLVGWVHEKDNPFFNSGRIATAGIEIMAETGATSTLVSELQALVDDRKGLKTYVGNGLGSGVGTISIDIEVHTDFPAVSLVTMVAPSPDWYVACVNANLTDDKGEFVDTKTLVGHVYDAGTDNGVTFTSTNSDTQPKAKITRFVDQPLGNGTEVKASFCTITFTKK